MGRAAIALVLLALVAYALTPSPSPSALGEGSRAADQTCPAPSPDDRYPVSPTPTATSGLTEPTPIPALDREASVDPRLDGLVRAAAATLQACWNAGEWEAVEALLTPRFLETGFGIASPDVGGRTRALANLGLGPLEIAEIGPVGIWSDGRGVVEVYFQRGQGHPRQAVAARWHVIAERGRVWFDEETPRLPPPLGDRITVGFSIPDDDQPLLWASPASSQIATSPVIALHGVNRGYQPHTVTLMDDGGRTIGLLTLPPGHHGDLVLLGLPPGTYRLVDPAVPGSEATLEVGRPLAVGYWLLAVGFCLVANQSHCPSECWWPKINRQQPTANSQQPIASTMHALDGDGAIRGKTHGSAPYGAVFRRGAIPR